MKTLKSILTDEIKKCGLCKPCGFCQFNLRFAAVISAVAFLVDSIYWCLWATYTFLALRPLPVSEPNPPNYPEMTTFLSMQFPIAFLYLLVSILLIIGVMKEKRILILIFLVGYLVVQVLAIIMRILSTTLVFYTNDNGGGTYRFFGLPIFNLFWTWYPLWICIAYWIRLGGNPPSKHCDTGPY